LYHRLNALRFHIPALSERREDIEDLAIHFLGRLHQTYKNEAHELTPPQLDSAAIEFLKNHPYRGNVRELKNILLRALLFSKAPVIRREDLINANPVGWTEATPDPIDNRRETGNLLEKLENGEGDFWSNIYQPFKDKRMTRHSVQTIINTAKTRYQTNLPGLAVKLGVCGHHFRSDRQENKKFISFKNFLYKTIKITSN